jgi:hypothetical protein
MHIYIYDSFLNQRKYDSTLAKIETRITDLGLNGRIIRLGITNSVYDAIENEIKKGAKTIVAVGNDNLLAQVLNSIAILESHNIFNREVPMGIIPVGNENNHIANYLGINSEDSACDILSARRVQCLDLGLANNNYFLSQAIINSKNTVINIDDSYTIETSSEGKINIINLPIYQKLPFNLKSNAIDGKLELFISTKSNKKIIPLMSKGGGQGESFIKFKKIVIYNNNEQLIIDDTIRLQTPVEISIAKEKINFIVGKDRKF